MHNTVGVVAQFIGQKAFCLINRATTTVGRIMHTAHLIRAGSNFEKEIKATIAKDKKIRFKDVVYDLDELNRIKITGIFSCDKQVTASYKKKYPQKIKKDFWTGTLTSNTITIEVVEKN